MRKRKQNKTLLIGTLLLFLAAILLVFQTCRKFEPQGFLHVTTGTVSDITPRTASISSEVNDDGGAAVSERGVCWSTSRNPEIPGSMTKDGTGTGIFTSAITGLSPGTVYYVRAYATNSQGTSYGKEVSFTTTDNSAGTVTDVDGNVYQTVQIGDQIWMAENLKTTRYADETDIPLVEGATDWENLAVTDRAYCWYDNSITNKDTYGGLYTWSAAMNGTASSDANPSGVQGVCPAGWHLPSDAEWKELEMYLGMSQSDADETGHRGSNEGGKLKETGTSHWDSPNTGATNESSFEALPGGYRDFNGSFFNLGHSASFRSSTSISASYAWERGLNYNLATVYRVANSTKFGFSVRCVKGEGTSSSIPVVVTGTATSVGGSSAVMNGEVTDEGGSSVIDCGFYYGTSTNPVATGTPVSESSGLGSYSTTLSGLTPGTSYYFVAYATNSTGTAYGDELSFSTSSVTTVTDVDGNVYQTVQIGEQLWMAENLRTTRYADETAISMVEGTTEWVNLLETDRAFCWYDNTSSYGEPYGALYTWSAATNGSVSSYASQVGVQGVCPEGWHLPGDDEWKELEVYLGMDQIVADGIEWRGTVEGGKLKESGTAHWSGSNAGATNESGFTALPGGGRDVNGSFSDLGNIAHFWTAKQENSLYAWYRSLYAENAKVYRGYHSKNYGRSVRCVEGEGSSSHTPIVITQTATSISNTSAVMNGEVTDGGGASVTDCGFFIGTTTDPVSDGTPISESSGLGSYSTTLTSLTPGTTYYFVAYATNSTGTSLGNVTTFATNDSPTATVTDIDGNVYQTVQIGDQVWMAENLKTTRYADGSAIPFVGTTSGWDALDENSKAYCWYDDAASNGAIYGGLYTWPAAMNGAASSDANPSGVQGVCPTGWHLPSDAEWKELEMYLGMSQSDADAADWRGTVEGGKLKEAGTDHWQSPNTGATNESGFTALPGGYRVDEGSFYGLSLDASIWTSTTIDEIRGWIRYLGLNSSEVNRILSFNAHGRSVRCLKDE